MTEFSQAEIEKLQYQSTRLEQFHQGMRFNPPQKKILRRIFRDGYKKIFIRKGRKGGGTHTICYPAARIAGTLPGRACYIIGPQEVLEREILWDNQRLQKFFPKQWHCRIRDKDARIIVPHREGSSYVKVHGADNWKRMVGIEGDAFVFDELADQDERAYKNCEPNIVARDALWMVAGAPPLERIKKSFYWRLEQEIREDPTWFFLHWTTWQNAKFLPGGIEGLKKLKEQYYRAGKWDEWEARYEARYIFGGAKTVLTNFIPKGEEGSQVVDHEVLMSEISNDARRLRWFQIYDPGFATCFCVLYVVYNTYQGTFDIVDEIFERNRSKLSVQQLWPRIVAKQRKLYPNGDDRWKRVYDSAAPGFPAEVREITKRDPDLDPRTAFIPTHKEKGDEDKYFRMWNSALALNRCRISTQCVHLQAEMEDYVTEENGSYPDADNHGLDNTRYFMKMGLFSLVEEMLPPPAIRDRPRILTLEQEVESVYSGDSELARFAGVSRESSADRAEALLRKMQLGNTEEEDIFGEQFDDYAF